MVGQNERERERENRKILCLTYILSLVMKADVFLKKHSAQKWWNISVDRNKMLLWIKKFVVCFYVWKLYNCLSIDDDVFYAQLRKLSYGTDNKIMRILVMYWFKTISRYCGHIYLVVKLLFLDVSNVLIIIRSIFLTFFGHFVPHHEIENEMC